MAHSSPSNQASPSSACPLSITSMASNFTPPREAKATKAQIIQLPSVPPETRILPLPGHGELQCLCSQSGHPPSRTINLLTYTMPIRTPGTCPWNALSAEASSHIVSGSASPRPLASLETRRKHKQTPRKHLDVVSKWRAGPLGDQCSRVLKSKHRACSYRETRERRYSLMRESFRLALGSDALRAVRGSHTPMIPKIRSN